MVMRRLKVAADAETICDELTKRGIAYRMEPRAMGFLIPVMDDPEGNMIELFPNIAHVELPGKALCPPEQIDAALAQIRAGFEAVDEESQSERRRAAVTV